MSTNMQSMALAVPQTGSLDSYIQYVSGINMLTAEEERALATQFREQED